MASCGAPPGAMLQQAAFAPDGRTLVACFERQLAVWDLAKYQLAPAAEGAYELPYTPPVATRMIRSMRNEW